VYVSWILHTCAMTHLCCFERRFHILITPVRHRRPHPCSAYVYVCVCVCKRERVYVFWIPHTCAMTHLCCFKRRDHILITPVWHRRATFHLLHLCTCVWWIIWHITFSKKMWYCVWWIIWHMIFSRKKKMWYYVSFIMTYHIFMWYVITWFVRDTCAIHHFSYTIVMSPPPRSLFPRSRLQNSRIFVGLFCSKDLFN